ncbi:HTH-type transcriptional regulator SgrR [Roseobacter fucihabitans]|uniref:HTH-type transcriptional regulator SgrR n=1 Tax=Roseobacter fucihabitans TaxID=1537242 RepID=A0ABZ2C171_9RHOB|nr:ABC transporter substrate-binding protein [Roseobacter litoralis]MBC6963831.1 Nickel-binding periplasmic protein precursor [Roseobacter litoralis]MBC6964084.1 Nickel-binding periplasmic protein precursor [Roseobacter litoralis]
MSVRRPNIDRRALFASGAAAALLAATGLSAGTSPVRGGQFRMALSGATRADGFDARAPQGLFMQVAMIGAVFETLTEIASDGTLRGELALAWYGSTDARVWVFDLRQDAVFHNGKPLDSNDVLASFDIHASGALSDVQEIETLSSHKIRITLSIPDADFPYRLSGPQMVIYPAGHIDAAMTQGIGTGLYRTHRFQPGRQFIGARVDDHYKDAKAGWFDRVELVSLPADAVRAEALRDHFVDAVDLTHSAELGVLSEITLLPEENFMTCAVRKEVGLPQSIGTRWPMDNLRAAQRWWIA